MQRTNKIKVVLVGCGGSVTWDGDEHFLAQIVTEMGDFISKY